MANFIRGSNLNQEYLPTSNEISIVSKFQFLIGEDYRLIRVTKTMLDKYTIDASGQLRELFKQHGIIDFSMLDQGERHKQKKNVGLIITPDGIKECIVSFYRPKSKNGDPRFWFLKSKKYFVQEKLLYITVANGKLVSIPVIDNDNIYDYISNNISSKKSSDLTKKFKLYYSRYKDQWIKSISPNRRNPKDVGDTLELLLGIKTNSSRLADIDGLIEIKSKRESSNSNYSLFSKVPDWNKSPIGSSKEMILTYGYQSKIHPGFIDLYITVNANHNNQGLSLKNCEKEETLKQVHFQDGLTCLWEHNILRQRLNEKHPNTIWVDADEKKENGEIYFRYKNEMSLTSNPVFSQFLTLVKSSTITFDWRGKVKPDGTKYRDHGHGFRIQPNKKNLLFSDESKFTI